ncbi:MAG: nucleotide exchange factor GrpE [Tannerellaceae bacterium]|nr:nucleotide exchange factor GrpE [Tannerellaceae bacterium]
MSMEDKNGMSEEMNVEANAPMNDPTEEIADAQSEVAENVENTDKVSDVAEPNWQERYEALNDTHLRLMAEFDNYRKRTMREKADLIRGGGESALTALLPVVDDVERAMDNLRAAADIAAVKEGIELIYGKFRTYLTQQGVTEINVVGQPLDTETSEAVTSFPAPQEELRGKVMDCIQKGYKLHDKVIRHAKVVVAEA